MKNLKKLVAALLALTFVLGMTSVAFAAPKFSKSDVESGLFVKFTGTVYGYKSASTAKRSDIIIRKGSVGLLTKLSGTKWGKVIITDGEMNATGKEKALWFKVDKLEEVEDQDTAYICCYFASGGDNMSLESEGKPIKFKYLKGKKVKLSGNANLRKTASLKGKSCGVVRKGQKLTCTGLVDFDSRVVVFFQVKHNGKKYYVSTQYLKNWADVLLKAIEEEGGI